MKRWTIEKAFKVEALKIKKYVSTWKFVSGGKHKTTRVIKIIKIDEGPSMQPSLET